MDDFVNFIKRHLGAIIGGIIALILACTSLYRVTIAIAIVIFGIWAGTYVQKNKEPIKEKLKNIIDKM